MPRSKTPSGKSLQRGIAFSNDQWDALKSEAGELGVSVSSLVRELVALSWHHTSQQVGFDPRLPGERPAISK